LGVSTTIETPSTAPVAEPSLDDIVAQELASAEAGGAEVVKDGEPSAQGGSEPDGAHTADPAGSTPAPATDPEPAADEPKADDVSAARIRKMLTKLDEREAAITAREAESGVGVLGELLKNPKAFLAKHGKSIDDVIDASIAEAKVAAPADDDNPRLTALERRVAAREQAEQDARQQTAIDGRKAEIHREIAGSTKFPLINEAKRQQDVTDFMVEYHSIHGKAISWDKAAATVESDLTGLGIAAAKKLGWTGPAKAAPAALAKDRPGTTSLSGDQRTAAPTTGDEPADPEKLMDYLVKNAGLG